MLQFLFSFLFGKFVSFSIYNIQNICTVAIVLPLPNPDDPKAHEACCPLCKTIIFRNLITMRTVGRKNIYLKRKCKRNTYRFYEILQKKIVL